MWLQHDHPCLSRRRSLHIASLGRPSAGAACGGSSSLPFLPLTVVEEHTEYSSSGAGEHVNVIPEHPLGWPFSFAVPTPPTKPLGSKQAGGTPAPPGFKRLVTESSKSGRTQQRTRGRVFRNSVGLVSGVAGDWWNSFGRRLSRSDATRRPINPDRGGVMPPAGDPIVLGDRPEAAGDLGAIVSDAAVRLRKIVQESRHC
jgi:hypothetical protein